MHRPWLIATILNTTLLPACVIDHGLGETAEGSSGESSSESSTSGNLDPSATSGQSDTAVTSDTGDTTDPVPPSTSDMPTSGTDGDPLCEPGELWVQWNEARAEPVPGINASFAAVLAGPCTIADIFGTAGEGPHAWALTLDCTLSGRIDGDADVIDQPMSPVFSGTSAVPIGEWLVLEPIGQVVDLRLVLDHWGMGWSRYAVIEHDIFQTTLPLLDLVSGEYPDPTLSGNWQEDIEAMLGGEPWHRQLGVLPVDTTCDEATGMCGEIPQALELSWPGLDPAVLSRGQDTNLGNTAALAEHYASVSAADDISQPLCTDTPLGDYHFAVWANIFAE